MSRPSFYSSIPSDSHLSVTSTCPITRIEAQRKFSPMALLVRHTTKMPVFA